MAGKQTVDLGNASLQGTDGDLPRVAFDKFNDNFDEIYDTVLSVKMYGAVGDGVTDDSAAFQAAFDAVSSTGQLLVAQAGHYIINSAITTTGHINLIGDGNKTILDFSGITGAIGLSILGSITQIEELASATAGSITLPFASAPSLAVGDVFIIYDTVDSSFSGFRPSYRGGEFCKVRGISGSNALLTNGLYSGYTPANVDVYKLNSKTVSLRNFRTISSGLTSAPIQVRFCDGLIIENVSASSADNASIEISVCYDSYISNGSLFNTGSTSNDNGLSIGNCQKFRVIGGDYYGRRHAIAIGGGDFAGAVPNRDGRIIGATLSNDTASGVSSAEFHGNCQDVRYQNCQIYGGGAFGGMDCGFDDCTVTNKANGVVLESSEIKGGEISARGCSLSTLVDPNIVLRSIVDFGGNSTPITASTDVDLDIIIENCSLKGSNLASGTDFMIFSNSSSTVVTNIKIDGITANVNAMGGVLRTEVAAGSANSEAIIVDNITNFPSGTKLHNPVGAAYSAVPQRMMRQSGSSTLSAATGTFNTNSAVITFKYAYPKAPVALSSVSGVSFNGNLPVSSGVLAVSPTTIQTWIYSPTAVNWSATSNVESNWSAGIEEI